jgi:hypothetical protein
VCRKDLYLGTWAVHVGRARGLRTQVPWIVMMKAIGASSFCVWLYCPLFPSGLSQTGQRTVRSVLAFTNIAVNSTEFIDVLKGSVSSRGVGSIGDGAWGCDLSAI